MFLDSQLRLSTSQTPTQGTSTVTTNAYDMGVAKSLGSGEPMALVFFIEAITASADSFTFTLITADNDALTSNVVVHLQDTFTAAMIPAGSIVALPIPSQPILMHAADRYIGGRYTLGASDALTVSAFILPLSFIQALKDYPTSIVIV
jgi:hypothetical protein